MNAGTAPVNLSDVVKAYNDTQGNDGKLNEGSAYFEADTKLELINVTWHKTTPEVHGASSKKMVELNSCQPGISTTVTVKNQVPGSTINIVSGYLTGISSKTATGTIQMPKEMTGGKDVRISLDLTKPHQNVIVASSNDFPVVAKLNTAGKVTVKSKANIFQGTFKATAKLWGRATFTMQDGQGTEIMSIQEMAREASNLKPPFKYKDNSLQWAVEGNMDYLLENITCTK